MKRSSLSRSKGLNPVSKKQKQRNRQWARVKMAKLGAQLAHNGFYFCEDCGISTRYLFLAKDELEADHIVSRAQGGADTVENCRLLCAWKCHKKRHGINVVEAETY